MIFGMPFEALPEEVQQKMREEHENAVTRSNDFRHRLEEFYDGLDDDQLDTFEMFLSWLSGMPEVQLRSMLNFLHGRMHQADAARRKVCAHCQVNHDAENEARLQAILQDATPERVGGISTDWGPTDPADQPEPESPVDEAYREAKMIELNLEFSPTGLRCARCFQAYISIEDRERDNYCSGCRLKDAHG